MLSTSIDVDDSNKNIFLLFPPKKNARTQYPGAEQIYERDVK
jgi:hypothetical protein